MSDGRQNVFSTQVDHTLCLTPGTYPSMHLSLRAPTVSLHFHIKGRLGAEPRPERKRRASTSTASRFNFSHGAIWISMEGDTHTNRCTHTQVHSRTQPLYAHVYKLTHAFCSDLLWFIFLFVVKIKGRTLNRGERKKPWSSARTRVCTCVFHEYSLSNLALFYTPG